MDELAQQTTDTEGPVTADPGVRVSRSSLDKRRFRVFFVIVFGHGPEGLLPFFGLFEGIVCGGLGKGLGRRNGVAAGGGA